MTNFNPSAWAIRHDSLTRYFIAVLMVAGIAAYFTLGQKEDPEFTIKTMLVRVVWPGASAGEVELQVTDKIEKKLQEVPGLDFITSYSKPGEAMILVNLKQSVTSKLAPEAWYQVRKKVGDIRATLPPEIVGPFFNDEFGETFGSVYAFTADGFSYAELKDAVERARQEFLRVPGVSKVEVIGAQDEKIYIEFSHKKIAALGIDPLTIVGLLKAQNAMTASGSVVMADAQVPLRMSGDFKSVEHIANIGLRANNRSFRLGDIAHIYRGYADPATFKMRFKGQEAIGLAISMSRDGNIITLGKSLAATRGALQTALPAGITIHQVSDQPAVVKRSVNEFMRSLLEALVIVLAVSFFSLGGRTGMVVALSIPLVLAATFLAMKFFGIDLHRISLGALIIALGLLVDDAMIAVEMMARKIDEGWDKMRAASFAYTSTAMPMLTGTLVTAAAFLPIGLAKSNAGEYTFWIFAVVSIALLISWIVAVVFTPYLGYQLLRERPSPHGDAIYQRGFYRHFRKWLTWCLRHRNAVIALTLIAFLLSLGAFRFIEQQFFPSSNRPELLVDMWLPEGVSLAATEAEVKKFEAKLAGDEDIVNFVSYVGGGSPRFFLPLDQQLSHTNFAQLVVMTGGLDARERTSKKIREIFANDLPLVRGRVTRLENGPPVGYPAQVRISGDDPAVLRRIAADIAAILRAHPGTRSVNTNWNEMIKVARLQIDQDKARALGITSQALAQDLQTTLSGLTVTQFREGDKFIDVVARAQADERDLLGAIKDINVHAHNGRSVPLSQVARIDPDFEEGIVWRRNRTPAITVRADALDGIQAPTLMAQIDPQLDPVRAKLPPGYRIVLAGSIEESGVAQDSIKAGVPIMLAVIFTLLMLQLQSFQRALLVFLTAPLGIIGVALALLIFNMPFGFVAMLGTISLGGMIMRNSVILVDQIERDIASGLAPWDAIIESAVRRFRPIMLTAAAAVLAMIPLARSIFWGPMAVAIMGGLIVATILTLLFLPALYAAWFKVKQPA